MRKDKDNEREYTPGSFDEHEGVLNAEQAIEEALEGEPRANELRRMRAALLQRRARLIEDFRASDENERRKLRRDLEKLEEQIQVLAEEANISAFVEDAVRVGIEMRKMQN